MFAGLLAPAVGQAVDFPQRESSAVERVVSSAQDLALFALAMLGVDYRFGGSIPEHGFDCSGLVQYVFQQTTGVALPRTSLAMSRLGQTVTPGDLRVGDLVFFNTRRFRYSHVGIYLGDGRFVHAPSDGGGVEIGHLSETYWRGKFDGARRLVGAAPTLIPSAAAASP